MNNSSLAVSRYTEKVNQFSLLPFLTDFPVKNSWIKNRDNIIQLVFEFEKNIGYENINLTVEHNESALKDCKNIDRVLKDESNDKCVLFVGFDQNIPGEGSEITCNTPGYRKSLFWS